MKRLLYIATLSIVLFSCKKQEKFLPPDFNYKIPDVPVSQDVNIGAYYSNYSGTDWSKKYTGIPTLGEYSALDASVMAQHRMWADKGGVNFFIFNWNGAASGDPLLNSFTNGRSEQVQMVINYNTAHLSASNGSPLTAAKLEKMINEVKSLATTHFDKEYYFKIDGKPVVLVTPLNLSSNAANSIDYTTVVPAVKQALNDIGIEIYLVGEISSGWLPPQRYATAIKSMDAVVLNNWSTTTYDRASFFASFSDINWKNWKDSTTAWGTVDFVPCVFPGYNDKTMSPSSKVYDIERTVDFYKNYCNVAKLNMSDKRLVFINSWNHFQVGNTLEPTVEYGETYLEATRKNFKVP